MLRSFVISSVITGVKSDAEFKNDIFTKLSKRLEVVLVNFNGKRVGFRKIFVLPALVMLGIIPGVKNDAEFKNDICRIVFQRLGAVLVNFNVNGVVFRKIFVLPA